jgi:hypothetical protein
MNGQTLGHNTMKSFNVIRAAAFRALKPGLFAKLVPLELATAVKEEYSFIKAPSDTNQPIEFQAGKLKYNGRIISIEQFVVTYVGNKATSLGVTTRTSSDDGEAFLDRLIDWAAERYQIDPKEVLPRAFFSQVEFVLPRSLSERFLEFKEISDAITAFVQNYGLKEHVAAYELTGFSINLDAVTHGDLRPMPQPFAVERRDAVPFDQNKYFSQAPLRTKDHRSVLERLERLLLK